MVLIIGPLFSGKQAWARQNLGLGPEDFSSSFPCPQRAVREAQALAAGLDGPALEALADALAGKEAVLCTEVGGGVVPIDPAQRAEREAAGRLTQLLARRAAKVVRIWYGLPQTLKDTREEKT